MHKLVSYIGTKIKGSEWIIDNRIPVGYLVQLVFSEIVKLIRGYLTFKCFNKIVLVGSNTQVKAKKLISISKCLRIDSNCYIDALSVHGIVIGNDVSIGKNTTIECSGSFKNLGFGMIIGNGVGLGTHGFFGCAGGVRIGSNTIFGNFVSIHSENHIHSALDILIKQQGVTRIGVSIGDNCWIGAKVTVLDGAVIGNGCIIGANSLVTKGIYEDNCIYGGVPALLIRRR